MDILVDNQVDYVHIDFVCKGDIDFIIHRDYWYDEDLRDANNLRRTILDAGSGAIDTEYLYNGYGNFAICNTRDHGELNTVLQVNPPGYIAFIQVDRELLKKLAKACDVFIKESLAYETKS